MAVHKYGREKRIKRKRMERKSKIWAKKRKEMNGRRVAGWYRERERESRGQINEENLWVNGVSILTIEVENFFFNKRIYFHIATLFFDFFFSSFFPHLIFLFFCVSNENLIWDFIRKMVSMENIYLQIKEQSWAKKLKNQQDIEKKNARKEI